MYGDTMDELPHGPASTPPSYEALQDELTQLRAIVVELTRAQSQPLPQQPPPQQPYAAPAYTPKARFPDPTKYSHEDPRGYVSFRLNLNSKLAIDRDTFRTEEEKVYYAFDRLTGVAARRMIPWIRAKQDARQLTLDGFIAEMDSAFDDPQRREKALVRVNSMKQGQKDLSSFLGEFNEALTDAGGLFWDDEQKKTLLQVAINIQLMSAMIGRERKPSYEGYCDQLRAVDEDLKQVNRIQSRRARTTRMYSAPAARDPNQMDWQPSQVNATRTNQPRREYWGTPEEIAQRRKEGLCLKCGRKGHLVRDCRAPTNRQLAKIAAAKNKPRVEEIDDDSSTYEDLADYQGKE